MLKKFEVIKEMLATVSKYSFKTRTAHVLFFFIIIIITYGFEVKRSCLFVYNSLGNQTRDP